MRALVLIAVLVSILGLLLGCDGDPAGLPADQVSGRILMLDGTAAPRGTTVYLVDNNMWWGPRFAIVDSTYTTNNGWFTFTDLEEMGAYRIAAGRYGSGGPSGWTHITPLSQQITVPVDEKVDERVILTLQPVVTGSHLSGSAFVIGDPLKPAENALINLWRLEGPGFVIVDSTRVAADGSYGLTDIATGNHIISGTIYIEDGESPQSLVFTDETQIFFVATVTGLTIDPLILSDIFVDKPAVYIYPEEAGEFEVKLGLGRGVRLTASDPVYEDGWTVFVDTDGRIDDAHDYLFYELGMPRPDLPVEGWCLDGARIGEELAAVAHRCGLNADESDEFVDYWADRLPKSPHWLAYPILDADLNRWATLDVSPVPDCVLRVWVFFEPSEAARVLTEPVQPPFAREGTTVIEWGGGVLPRPPV